MTFYQGLAADNTIVGLGIAILHSMHCYNAMMANGYIQGGLYM
jgi:hypothetical protein